MKSIEDIASDTIDEIVEKCYKVDFTYSGRIASVFFDTEDAKTILENAIADTIDAAVEQVVQAGKLNASKY